MLQTQRVHLFPFRTQKLSSAVAKILYGRLYGKIYTGYDPDVNIYGSVLKYGIDMGGYPAARTYLFDVKISF